MGRDKPLNLRGQYLLLDWRVDNSEFKWFHAAGVLPWQRGERGEVLILLAWEDSWTKWRAGPRVPGPRFVSLTTEYQ